MMSTDEHTPIPSGLKPVSQQRAQDIALEYLRTAVPTAVWHAVHGKDQYAREMEFFPVVKSTFLEMATPVKFMEVTVFGQKASLENS